MRGSITLGITAGRGSGETPGDETHTVSSSVVGPFENNSTVRLQSARYRGDVKIRANRVEVVGVHPQSTAIDGDVHIYGNSCTLRSLSVTGDVYLYGNNNDVRSIRVDGQVVSKGKNNKW